MTHPARMLWARASKNAIVDFAPEVALGIAVDDELQEIEPAAAPLPPEIVDDELEHVDPMEPDEELVGEWLNENDENIVDAEFDVAE